METEAVYKDGKKIEVKKIVVEKPNKKNTSIEETVVNF